MTFDSAVPQLLKNTQQWFASIITRPIDENSTMNPISPSGRPMVEEAWDHILPSPTLQPAQRIQIYNQQYWWRLLSTMHDVYPLVVRLFGYHDFNQQLAMPFIVKYPPNHWSLSYLGERFPQWIEEEYHAGDKTLVLNATKVDFAYNSSFLSGRNVGIESSYFYSEENAAGLLELPLTFQTHLHLFEIPYDLFQFRVEFLKQEVDYWIEHDFPELIQNASEELYHFVLYRTRGNSIAVETISANEFKVLKRFESGATVDLVCQWLEEQQDATLSEEASNHLNLWFQRWIANQWLTQISYESS